MPRFVTFVVFSFAELLVAGNLDKCVSNGNNFVQHGCFRVLKYCCRVDMEGCSHHISLRFSEICLLLELMSSHVFVAKNINMT